VEEEGEEIWRGRRGRRHDKEKEEREYTTRRRRGDDMTSRPGSCPFTM